MEEYNKQQEGVTDTTETTVPTEPIQETAPQDVAPAPPVEGGKKNLGFMVAAVVLAALVLAGLYLAMQFKAPEVTGVDGADTAAQNMDTINPDSVVARVNGTELLGSDLSYQLVQVAQLAGIPSLNDIEPGVFDSLKAEAINAIVNTEVLVQAAGNDGLSVNDTEVETEFAGIVGSIGGQEVANERLTALGISEADFKENLRSDLLIEKYLVLRAEPGTLAVTDQDIQAFYDQVTNGQTENVPPLADVRLQIEQQLELQKKQVALVSILEGLRSEANIEILSE